MFGDPQVHSVQPLPRADFAENSVILHFQFQLTSQLSYVWGDLLVIFLTIGLCKIWLSLSVVMIYFTAWHVTRCFFLMAVLAHHPLVSSTR